ncbi:uncharacterized protein MELLADRAFT_93852 [Melampsora larici-populina 98AG31]|uniref:Uncharacterized protein n=1 Tax=Melampsora larici-populina (strain 98AG31 / pathotype 3-4-7) TaxID=747676 RepID=F4S5H2_MELLP|nr:uncharacterized protein MELLADRAFT_93852 [Melampsora larici-populina 98AG31]EGG00108.1 hypothetical protein MELLADRAFT_93852 [Melampsora larici-populina 98AG31]
MVMGIPWKARGGAKKEDLLPEPPTEEERLAWSTRKQSLKQLIRDTQDKAMKKYLAKKAAGFQPNRKQRKMIKDDACEEAALKGAMRPVVFRLRMASGGISRYPHHFGSQCEADLALAGFPRCTFDWGASYDTPWNSATSSIILANWVKAFNANAAKGFGILTSENTAENREQILRRWVGNKKQKYKDQEKLVDLMKTPEGVKQVQEQEAIVKGIARKRRMLIKIVDARKAVVVRYFGKDSSEYAMVDHMEIHSEDEIMSSGSSVGRKKKRLQWRSTKLDTFIGLLDKAHKSRKKIFPKERRAAAALVDRGPYAPEADTERFPPKGFQSSLISPTWIKSQEGLVIAELDLNADEPVDINSAIDDISLSLRSAESMKSDIRDDNMTQ